MTEQSRDAFEKWVKESGSFTDWSRHGDGYAKPLVDRTWRAWCEAVEAERERCLKIVGMRANLWRDAVKAGSHQDCSMSLWEECEDIAAAINNGLAGGEVTPEGKT